MKKTPFVISGPRPSDSRRSGVAVFWFILAMPVFIAGMILVIDMAFVWLCRAEAQDAASAGALAGVKIPWNESSCDLGQAETRLVVNDFIASNPVGRTSISLGSSPGSQARVVCTDGQILLGEIRFEPSGAEFQVAASDDDEIENRGCHVALTLQVDSLCLGTKGAYTVQVSATAVDQDGKIQLLRIHSITD